MFEYFFRSVVGRMSGLHDFDGIPIMVLYISSSVSVEAPYSHGLSLVFGVFLFLPLKIFLMFCILLKKNVTKSSASCWYVVDSGNRFFLFWPVVSVIVL